MNSDEAIKECAACAMQIRRYDPDPHYTGYYFGRYLVAAGAAVDGIFAEADADFGLFAGGRITQEAFAASLKHGDTGAAEFLEWYENKHSEWHSGLYPRMMNSVRKTVNSGRGIRIEIMIRAADRYKDDPVYHIGMNMTIDGRLRSKPELDVAVRRHAPIFAEVVNHKRRLRNEPLADVRRVAASAFAVVADADAHEQAASSITATAAPAGTLAPHQMVMELAYSTKVYTQLLRRIVEESRLKMRSIITSHHR